jgi:MFS family permease
MALSQITPIYLKEKFNVTSVQQGLFFSVVWIPNLIMQPLGGWLADKHSRRKIIIASLFLYPFMMVLWPNLTSYTDLLFLRVLMGARAFSGPASQAYLMDFAGQTSRGLAYGIGMLGMRLGGTVVGTPFLGYLYEQYGLEMPFYVAAILPLPAIPILMLLKEKITKKVE